MFAVTGPTLVTRALRATSSAALAVQRQRVEQGVSQGENAPFKPGNSAVLNLISPRRPTRPVTPPTFNDLRPAPERCLFQADVLAAAIEQNVLTRPNALKDALRQLQPAPERPVLQADVLAAAMEQDALTRSRALRDALRQLQSENRTPPDAGTLLRTMHDTLREQQRDEALLRREPGSDDAGHDSDSDGAAPAVGEPSTPLSLRDIEACLQRQLSSDDEGYGSEASDGAEGAGPQPSSSEFLQQIFALMERLNEEWISRFSGILENYVAFFNKLTDAMALLSSAIKKTDNNGNLIVNFTELKNALSDLHRELAQGEGLGGNFATKAEAEAFLDELGLKDLMVKQKADGSWEVAINPDLIVQLRDLFPPKNPDDKSDITLSPAAHAALISAKDTLMERFNHINRVLPDKYQRQLQMWDTLVKTLSGTIESLAEANKVNIQNIA